MWRRQKQQQLLLAAGLFLLAVLASDVILLVGLLVFSSSVHFSFQPWDLLWVPGCDVCNILWCGWTGLVVFCTRPWALLYPVTVASSSSPPGTALACHLTRHVSLGTYKIQPNLKQVKPVSHPWVKLASATRSQQSAPTSVRTAPPTNIPATSPHKPFHCLPQCPQFLPGSDPLLPTCPDGYAPATVQLHTPAAAQKMYNAHAVWLACAYTTTACAHITAGRLACAYTTTVQKGREQHCSRQHCRSAQDFKPAAASGRMAQTSQPAEQQHTPKDRHLTM